MGQSLPRQVSLTALGVPLTGATCAYSLWSPRGTALITAQSVAESATPGTYSVDLDGGTYLTTAGAYRERWVFTDGTDDYPIDAWFVLGPWVPGLLARWELRHRVARELRDHTAGIATGGTTTSLRDTERWEPDHHWRGYECYLYAGTGRGQSRRITESLNSGGVLTWATAGTAPDPTTRYELHRRWDVATYNDALDRALTTARPFELVDVADESLAMVADTWEYSIPAPFAYLRAVWWRPDTDTDWRPLRFGDGDWELGPGRVLRIKRPRDEGQLRLLGAMPAPDLSSDDSLVGGNTEYLVWRAAATLLGSRLTASGTDAEGIQAQLTYVEARANAASLDPRGRVRPDSRRVLD